MTVVKFAIELFINTNPKFEPRNPKQSGRQTNLNWDKLKTQTELVWHFGFFAHWNLFWISSFEFSARFYQFLCALCVLCG